MKIRPRLTEPGTKAVFRRHLPTPNSSKLGFQSYRDCLGWEFGFTCCYCLLHERQLGCGGVEQSGLMTVEHRVLKSVDATLRNDYANCYWACRRCNSARHTAPLEKDGARLLDPCSDAWADHFERDEYHLVPITADGKYTEQSYAINGGPRPRARQIFAEQHELALDAIDTLPQIIRLLEEMARSSKTTDEGLLKILETVGRLRELLRLALRQLEHFRPVPDEPRACFCDDGVRRHDLPAWIAEQLVELSDLDLARARAAASGSS